MDDGCFELVTGSNRLDPFGELSITIWVYECGKRQADEILASVAVKGAGGRIGLNY
jgi:hypothetical protein